MASGRPEWPAAAGAVGIVWGYLGLSGIIAALVDASVREFGHTDLLQVNTDIIMHGCRTSPVCNKSKLTVGHVLGG